MTDRREPAAITIDEFNAFAETLTMEKPPMIVEDLARDWVRGRIPTADIHLRPGGFVPGPVMMAAVDFIAWIALFTRNGITPMALTWDLKINFLRPAHGGDVIVEATQTKFGRLCHATIELSMADDPTRLVAHATTTYALPQD